MEHLIISSHISPRTLVFVVWLSGHLLVSVNSREVAAETAGVTDMAVNAPAHVVPQKSGPWTTNREPVSLWRAEIDGKKKCLVTT